MQQSPIWLTIILPLASVALVFAIISLVFKGSKNKVMAAMRTEGLLMSEPRVRMTYHMPYKKRITLVDLYLSNNTLAAFQPMFNVRNLCLPLDKAATEETQNTRFALGQDKNGKAFLRLITDAGGGGEMHLHPQNAGEWLAAIRDRVPDAIVDN